MAKIKIGKNASSSLYIALKSEFGQGRKMAKIELERNEVMEKITAYINEKGEIKEPDDGVLTYYSQSEYENRKNFGRKHYAMKQQDESDYANNINEGGNYVWHYFVPTEPNFDSLNNPTISRLVYLATYVNGDNYIAYDNGRILSRCQLQDLLKLGDTAFKSFLKEAKRYNYLTEDEYGFKINTNVFGKGKLQKNKDQRAAKLFIYSTRFLYENTTIDSHKTLAYMYMILPYVNLTYNVLCDNPWETDKTKIHKMSVDMLCERLGLDISHSKRFVNQLLKIQFPDINGDKRGVLVSVRAAKNDVIKEYLCVNPMLYSIYANKEKIAQITGIEDVFLIKE